MVVGGRQTDRRLSHHFPGEAEALARKKERQAARAQNKLTIRRESKKKDKEIKQLKADAKCKEGDVVGLLGPGGRAGPDPK